MALVQQSNANRINNASAENLQAAFKRAIFDLDACTINEKATLSSVLELAPSSSILKKYVDTQIADIQSISKIGAKSLENLAKVCGETLHIAVKLVTLTP